MLRSFEILSMCARLGTFRFNAWAERNDFVPE